MSKIEEYRALLRETDDWDALLLKESRLPGPRANLELAHAVAEEGDEACFQHLLSFSPEEAPTNTPGEFLACCGVLGLGRLLAEGQRGHLTALRRLASDPRWRVREVVAMALQRFGDDHMPDLITEMKRWSAGNPLEKRAVAAALCEPRLLGEQAHAIEVLRILDEITASIAAIPDRRSEPFRALRKDLGYCWSVAVVACPKTGKALMEKWLTDEDADLRWIMKSNLKKKRLERMDKDWVERSQEILGS